MSTAAFERPMLPGPFHERRRRSHSSAEVIDVDSFVPDDAQFAGSSSQRGVPILIHSDDEQEPSSSTRSPPRRHSRAGGFRFGFSPPPPRLDASHPPVPPIPRYLRQQAQPLMRLRPPPFPGETSGVVRPSAQPFSFESNISASPRRAQSPPLAAAPPSHHQPVMGLGGAIISLNRQNAVAEDTALRRARELEAQPTRGRMWNLPSLVQASGFLSSMMRLADGEPDAQPVSAMDHVNNWAEYPGALESRHHRYLDLDPMGLFDLDDMEYPPTFHLYHPFRRRDRRADLEYKSAYTHPGNPASGFSFDFGSPQPSTSEVKSVIVIDDSPGPSANAQGDDASSILVCAVCLDPLVLGSGNEATEEGRMKRRVWALRCGHMLDGKCVEEIMKPKPQVTEIEGKEDMEHVQDEGKDRAMSMVAGHQGSAEISKGKGKGKRKAEAGPEQEIPSVGRLSEHAVTDVGTSGSGLHQELPNSIRARLRRRPAPSVDSIPSSVVPSNVPSSASHRHPAHPLRSVRRRRGSGTHFGSPVRPRGKGKAKARQPVVEAEWEWKCPVSDCGKVHLSLLMDGKWVMDKERGAIGTYV